MPEIQTRALSLVQAAAAQEQVFLARPLTYFIVPRLVPDCKCLAGTSAAGSQNPLVVQVVFLQELWLKVEVTARIKDVPLNASEQRLSVIKLGQVGRDATQDGVSLDLLDGCEPGEEGSGGPLWPLFQADRAVRRYTVVTKLPSSSPSVSIL